MKIKKFNFIGNRMDIIKALDNGQGLKAANDYYHSLLPLTGQVTDIDGHLYHEIMDLKLKGIVSFEVE